MTQGLLLVMALVAGPGPDTFDVQVELQGLYDEISQATVDPEGVTVIVDLTTVRTIVDHEGRYGRAEVSHTLTETTVFRDRWVRVSGEWKLKSREQIGRPIESVDKHTTDVRSVA